MPVDRPLDLLGLGEPLLEFAERGADDAPTYLAGFGGDTSNATIAAARQGAACGYVTRVGQDVFGDRFVALWAGEGVATEHVARDPEAPTGVYFISYDEGGHAFTYYRRGSAASRMRPESLPLAAIKATRLLHLSGISQAISDDACDSAFAAVGHAREGGTLVSYDPNLRLKLWPLARARAIVMETVALSDIVLPSLEDAVQLVGEEDPDALVDAFLNRGAKIVALKLGAEGVLVAGADERHRIAGHRVESVDATGAGDTFDGAFLAEHLRGAALQDAARYANAAAALSTMGHGAVAPIPRRDAVEAFLAARG
jgi:2-dehydro-3-deoxygluconokinase